MTPDYERAATAAAETLFKNRISRAPVDPLVVLKCMNNVLVVSYSEVASVAEIERSQAMEMFGAQNMDAVTTCFIDGGVRRYVITINQRLPFFLLQRALARELGHIVLGHDGSRPENVRTEEALTFARHFLCPRPLIRAVQDAGVRITVELLGTMTGCYERCVADIQKTPGVHVPAPLNDLLRLQFKDYVADLLAFQALVGEDASAPVDFGSYMEGYEE